METLVHGLLVIVVCTLGYFGIYVALVRYGKKPSELTPDEKAKAKMAGRFLGDATASRWLHK
jgi:hypothetical protein